MAITIKLLPYSVSLPRPLIPSEKIVGNIIDMKKAIPITEYMAMYPCIKIAGKHNRIHRTEYIAKSRSDEINLIKNTPINLPSMKANPQPHPK